MKCFYGLYHITPCIACGCYKEYFFDIGFNGFCLATFCFYNGILAKCVNIDCPNVTSSDL